MVPGFVNTYKDKGGSAHLFFFPGIDENGNNIYNNIDMSTFKSTYDMETNSDNSIDIKFHNKNIIKIHVKLIKNSDASVEHRVLNV